MNAKTEAAVTTHGEHLKTIFGLAESVDPVKLCKQLRRLETKGNALALLNCNVGIEEELWEQSKAAILRRVDALLGFTRRHVPVFLNGDPRGYALKIESEWMRDHDFRLHRDWGGYGIIAPDLTEK